MSRRVRPRRSARVQSPARGCGAPLHAVDSRRSNITTAVSCRWGGFSLADEPGSFLARLRQRHVFRVAAMYAVTSWFLLQLGSVTFEPLGFPPWSQRALIVLITVGFPITLALAWIFDVTPKGIVRTGDAPTVGLNRGRKLDVVIIVVLAAALAVTFLWRREGPSGPGTQDVGRQSVGSRAGSLAAGRADASDPRAIAVLPFMNSSGDASVEPIANGLVQDVLTALGHYALPRVASRTSTVKLATTGRDAQAIAASLKVGYLLDGSVRATASGLRIDVELIRAGDGYQVWSEQYERADGELASDTGALGHVVANTARMW